MVGRRSQGRHAGLHSLWIDKHQLATSTAQQVTKARAMLDELGLDVATPGEARAMLKLKGRENVGF